jgi:PAS domain S-box-containing protein
MSDKRAEQRGGADSGELPAAALHGADSLRDPAGNRAEAVLAGISDGITALDNDWRLVYANPAVVRLLGRDVTKLIGRTLDQLLDLAADDPFRGAYRASKQSGEQLTFTKYSEIFSSWIDVRGYPHPGGYVILFRLQGASGPVSQDLLDSERQREVIRSINQRIFDTSLDLILVVDRRGDVLRVSPSSRAILGFAPEELTALNGTAFVHPADLESTRNNMRLARHGRLTRNFECRYVHKDGHAVPLSWTGVWSEPDGQYFFIGRDMTDRVSLESQLRQAQKMEAVGQLTGGVAHDFNNILTVIMGMTEVLAGEVSADPRLAPLVAAIDEATSRGAELTRRMLAFARKQPLQPLVVDLNEIVSGTTAMLRRTLGEDIAVKLVLADGLWPALADRSQIEDALLNLAVNARDAMPSGGRLVIETANAHLDEQYAAHNLEVAPGDYVCVSVSDSGVGIPPDILERVFEPFFTTKEVGRGTGLGLSMVYGFAKQSGGHVKIYSEIGHGTRIRLYLPRTAAAEREAEPAAPPAVRAHPAGHETILVVEDSESVRKVAVSILRGLGYQVLEAEDGPSALTILASSAVIDLLFTDLIMPNGIDGEELLKRAHVLRPGLKALFTSGYSEHFLQSRGNADVGVPLLNKPYRVQKLSEAVRKALDSAAPGA